MVYIIEGNVSVVLVKFWFVVVEGLIKSKKGYICYERVKEEC